MRRASAARTAATTGLLQATGEPEPYMVLMLLGDRLCALLRVVGPGALAPTVLAMPCGGSAWSVLAESSP